MDNVSSQIVPKLAGTNKWTTTRQSIQELLKGRSVTYFVLNFYSDSEKLPQFGLTTFPVKELFWELAKEDIPLEKCGFILKHKWNEKDAEYWEDLEPGCAFPVAIFMRICNNEPNKVKVLITPKYLNKFFLMSCLNTMARNQAFTSLQCVQFCRMPISSFSHHSSNFNENTKNQMALYNPHDFLQEYSNRVKEGLLSKKATWEFEMCVGCCSNAADIVIIPCGHTVFCSRCEIKWKDKCPCCKSELGLDLKFSRCKSRIPSKQCMICPKKFNCHKMDCMLFPCGCIIGCCTYAEKAILPSEGGKCPNCKDEVNALQKVFIQQEARY